MMVVGHSYTAGSTQTNSGTSNVYQESLVSKVMSNLKMHDDNVVHLGQAGSILSQSGTSSVAGWGSVAQLILPSNTLVANAANDLVLYNPIVAVNGLGLIVHGCNDFALKVSGFNNANDNTAIIANDTAASKNAYRFAISRMRSGAVIGSYINTSNAVAWDTSLAFSASWATNTSGVTQNSGPAYRSTATTNETCTFTVPTTYTGGIMAVNFIGQYNAVTHLTGNVASSGGVTLAFSNTGQFPTSGTAVIKIGTEEMVATFTSSTGATVAAGDRGANSTVAAAHSTNDVITVATDAHRVDVSGTASSASGSIALSGQGTNGLPVIVTTRFTLTAADAGKTFIFTAKNFITNDTSAKINFDTIQFEAPAPGPVVVTNLHDWNYGQYIYDTEPLVAAWNTMLTALVAEFTDGFVKIADVNTPFIARNGVTASTLPATGDSGTSTATSATTLTDTTKGWAVNALTGATVTSNGKTLTVTSNTATIITGSGGWTGGTPASGLSYTVSGNNISLAWTCNSSSFTPTIGQVFSVGQIDAEHFLVTAVSGSAPNWVLGLTRGFTQVLNGTNYGATQKSKAIGNFFGPMDWMSVDDIHLTTQGHGVYAQTIQSTITTITNLSTYQVSQNGGNWSQRSQIPAMGIIDQNWWSPRVAANYVANTVRINNQNAIPVYVPKTCILTGMSVIPNASNSGTIRFGIYYPDVYHSRPGLLLADFGAKAFVTTTTWSTTTHQFLRPGWYWLSAAVQATAVSMKTFATSSNLETNMTSTALPTGANNGVNGYYQTGISGAFADWVTYTEQSTGVAATTVDAILIINAQFRTNSYG